MILLDTHALVWLANDDAALGRSSRSLLNEARNQQMIAVSAVSFWEVALLAEKRRINLAAEPDALRRVFLDTGVTELPLTGDVAIMAAQLPALHGDPADRLIVATAIAHDAMLMTADRALLRWRHRLPRQDASK